MKGSVNELEAVHRLTADYYAQIGQKYGLKFFHIRYLMEICENPGRQQDSFVRRGNLNKSSIARHFAFLEENGFIRRQAGENDRRSLRIFPTEKAQKAMPDFQQALARWEQALLRGVSAQEEAALGKILLQIQQNAEAFLLAEEIR